jgi:hypothetical protein
MQTTAQQNFSDIQKVISNEAAKAARIEDAARPTDHHGQTVYHTERKCINHPEKFTRFASTQSSKPHYDTLCTECYVAQQNAERKQAAEDHNAAMRARYDVFREIAAQLTTQTGQHWKIIEPQADTHHHSGYPMLPSGAELTNGQISFDIAGAYKKKTHWDISPNYPQTHDGRNSFDYKSDEHRRGEVSDSATLSKSKTPAQIARDIARRVLPGLTTETAYRRDKMQRTVDSVQSAENLLQRMIDASGDKLKRDNHHTPSSIPERKAYTRYDSGISLEIEARGYSTPSVKLSADLTPEQAAAVIALLCK